MKFDAQAVVQEIDAVLKECKTMIARGHQEWEHCQKMAALLGAAISRHAPPGSVYRTQMAPMMDIARAFHSAKNGCNGLTAILEAMRDDFAAGRLRGAAELIHADVFTDFLEMGTYLLDEGYKDPAAVIAGSTLEGHLRKLCDKHGVPTTDPTTGAARKASMLNADLRKAGAYDKSDEKSVTAWLGLRNDAAHGDYAKYVAGQVALLVDGVRDFIRRLPA